MLVGSLTSVFGYRRPLMSVFDDVYSYLANSPQDENAWSRVSRAAAEDLLLAALLGPAAETDVSAPHSDLLLASDVDHGDWM